QIPPLAHLAHPRPPGARGARLGGSVLKAFAGSSDFIAAAKLAGRRRTGPGRALGEAMGNRISRRDVLRLAAAQGVAALPGAPALPSPRLLGTPPGWVVGHMTGAAALTAALQAEGCGLVFGIPGAQENELWDTFKARRLPYHLVTHEFCAAAG